jgi:Subtilase family
MASPSIRAFLGIPDRLTGRGVGIAVIDGTFTSHLDISDGYLRRSLLVQVGRADAEPEAVRPTLEDWPAGAHGLGAAAAGGSGSTSAGVYEGAAPEADLWLLAGYVPGEELTNQQRQLRALHWLRDHWRQHGIRGAATAVAGPAGSALLPWQADPLRLACEELWSDGLLVVAATGNQPDSVARIAQAAAPSVLAVGGVRIPSGGEWRQAAAYHGCRGTTFEGKWTPDLLAPAAGLVLPFPPHPEGEAPLEGTSFAGPIVLGAAACVWQAHPNWSAARVKSALMGAVRRRPAWKDLGAGLVDVAAAAEAAGPVPEDTPSPYRRYLDWRSRPANARLSAVRFGDETSSTVEALLSCLPDQVTGEIATILADTLPKRSSRWRTAALCALAARPDRLDADLLRLCLDDADRHVRAAALHAVRAAPHTWAVLLSDVGRRLTDTEPDVIQAAATLVAEMHATELVEALVGGLEEDVRRRRPSCFAARTTALERLTGVEFRPSREWRPVEPLFDRRWWRKRQGVAARWRRWLLSADEG